MAYIKKVNVPLNWTALETLLDTTFSNGHLYAIQAHKGSSVRLCNATSLPTGPEDGESIENLMQAYFSKDNGTLYVKRADSLPAVISVSDLGE